MDENTKEKQNDSATKGHNNPLPKTDSFRALENEKEKVRRRYVGTSQWMKAPNRKPTNLTEDQWLTVRTDSFKKWFGDWEAAAEYALNRKVATINEAKEAAKEFVGKNLINSQLGIFVVVSNANIRNMTSENKMSKSDSPKLHLAAVANLDKLFESAEIKYTHIDRDKNPNFKQIHRIFTPFMFEKNFMLPN